VNAWYLGIGIALVMIALWLVQVEVTGDQYAAQSVQWCEEQNFGATGQCVNAYPTGTMNAIVDTMLGILLAGAFFFIGASFLSTKRKFGWAGGAVLGAICLAIVLTLHLANSGPSPYGSHTPLGTELGLNFQAVDCLNSSGSPRCDYIFEVNYTAENVTASDIWIALGSVLSGGGNGSLSSLGKDAVLNSTTDGCTVAIWTFSSNAWTSPSSGGCPAIDSSSQLVDGETLTLVPSSPGRSLSGHGYELVFVGNTNAIDGEANAPIP
jgi:hypothetical protein